MKMKLEIIAPLVVLICGSLVAQSAIASERHQTRTKECTVATKNFRNSNAYAVPAEQLYGPDLSEGAMTSGIAGH
jgi:galactokinase